MAPRARLARRRFLGAVATLAGASAGLTRAAAGDEGGFTVALLPDTQFYCERHPQILHAQTRWLAEHAAERRIAFALHLGDVTNRNSPEQWAVAREACARLGDALPYAMALGNHDLGAGGEAADRSTLYADFFPPDAVRGRLGFLAAMPAEPDRLENSAWRFPGGGRDWLVLVLEFGPRAAVVAWAADVLAAHPGLPAIVVTHAHLYHDDTRYDWQAKGPQQAGNPHSYGVAAQPGGVHDGEQLWQSLVSRHDSIVLVVNGHVGGDGLGLLESATVTGHTVQQMLVNFQMLENGGDGWLRLLEFSADGRTIRARDYSPTLERWGEGPDHDFTIGIDLPDAAVGPR